MNIAKICMLMLTVLFLSACMSPPEGLDLSTQRLSEHGRYRVQIKPLEANVPVNKIHRWEVQVMRPGGEPVSGVKIGVDGGMPQHGHGLPTKPRVTRELGNGQYLVEGMKFNMSGWWEIKITVADTQASDKATFNLVVRS
jgi:hypothetical protein